MTDRKPTTTLERKLVAQYPGVPLDTIWKFRKVEQANRRRARKAGRRADKVDYLSILIAQGWACSICGEPMDRDLPLNLPDGISLEHNPALGQGGHHITEHVSGAHRRCNMAKNNSEDTPKAAKVKRVAGITGQYARRQRAKAKGTYRPIAGRGFQKGPSRLSKDHPGYRKPKFGRRPPDLEHKKETTS